MIQSQVPELFDAPMPGLARATLGELAVCSIESWPQAVVFLAPEEPMVFWANPTAERVMRDHGITLAGGRIQLAQRERQKDLERFLSIATPEVQSWVLDLVGEGSALVFRCRTIDETGFRLLTIFHPDTPPTSVPDVGALFGLTPSETRIMRGLVDGRRADKLAEELGVSIETVRTHIRRFYNKLGVNSREQMIAKVSAYRVP
jgi:DNA-binding CsgD family transcriptional regulator